MSPGSKRVAAVPGARRKLCFLVHRVKRLLISYTPLRTFALPPRFPVATMTRGRVRPRRAQQMDTRVRSGIVDMQTCIANCMRCHGFCLKSASHCLKIERDLEPVATLLVCADV